MIHQKTLILIGAVIGAFIGIRGVVVCYAVAECISAQVFAVLLLRDHAWFLPKQNPQAICNYSITLQPDKISAVSREVEEKLQNGAFPEGLAQKVALLIEESLRYIDKQNPKKEIRADIKVNRHEDGVRFTIVDDGSAYNPITAFDIADAVENDALEETIILGLSSKVEYDRALDLNQLSVLIKLPVS